MLQNRLAISRKERQSESDKRHGKVLDVKKEIEDIMQSYKSVSYTHLTLPTT